MAKKHLTSRHFFFVFPFSLLRLRLIYYLKPSHLSREKKRKRKEFKYLYTRVCVWTSAEFCPRCKYWCVSFRRRRFGARASSHNIKSFVFVTVWISLFSSFSLLRALFVWVWYSLAHIVATVADARKLCSFCFPSRTTTTHFLPCAF